MTRVIEITGLGKRYARSNANRSIRDFFSRHRRASVEPSAKDFWALRDVSLSVDAGECIGVIGRNGAGKSTLLKVLSRVTLPSIGGGVVRGRVASLLEVGTGFHPELTGRENVYLSGSVLGMSQREIARQFDEIIHYSGVGGAIDTPVKRYSSGMYLRLAFAVAAHLAAEILFLDEILAVGDAAFQRKCLTSMESGVRSGKTILLVSHNVSLIQALCRRSIVLQDGRKIFDGPTSEAVAHYLGDAALRHVLERAAQANGDPTVVRATIAAKDSSAASWVEVELEVESDGTHEASCDFRLVDDLGIPVGIGSLGYFHERELVRFDRKRRRLRVRLDTSFLAVGGYRLMIDLAQPNQRYFDRVEEGLAFEVERAPKDGALLVARQDWRYGSVQLPMKLVEG